MERNMRKLIDESKVNALNFESYRIQGLLELAKESGENIPSDTNGTAYRLATDSGDVIIYQSNEDNRAKTIKVYLDEKGLKGPQIVYREDPKSYGKFIEYMTSPGKRSWGLAQIRNNNPYTTGIQGVNLGGSSFGNVVRKKITGWPTNRHVEAPGYEALEELLSRYDFLCEKHSEELISYMRERRISTQTCGEQAIKTVSPRDTSEAERFLNFARRALARNQQR